MDTELPRARARLSVRSLASRGEPLGDSGQALLLEGHGGLVALAQALVDLRLVLANEGLNEGQVKLARALELGEKEPHQEPELEEGVERYPRDDEVCDRFYDCEEGEDDPVRQPLRGRVRAVGLQGLEDVESTRETRGSQSGSRASERGAGKEEHERERGLTL